MNQTDEENLLKETRQLLQGNEAIYRLMVEGVQDYAIFMLDTAGNIVTWNLGAERTKGYKAQEIIGKHFSAFYLPQAVADKFPDYELRKAKEDGRFEDEGWRVRKDGSTFWANVVITAIYTGQQQHIGFAKITRDLTEKVRNEELMNKNKELHKINTDLDNFIYTASHDLKAPIANLQGLLSLLDKRMEQKINPADKKIMELMHVSIVNLNQTIASLTEITKVQRDIEASVEPISFDEVLTHVKADIQQLIAESGAVVEEQLEVVEVLFNRAYLRSIVYNLLTNALKYRSPDRPLHIRIHTYSTPGYTVLSVKDNGLGLTESQKARLFTLFRRFHTHVEGSGMGLYMIKRIIENKHGRVEVESKINEGSVFNVFFPKPPSKG